MFSCALCGSKASFVDASTNTVIEGSTLKKIEVLWKFDETVSNTIVVGFDKNKNGKVDPGLGMARAGEHAAAAGDQWKDVAGAEKIVSHAVVIRQRPNGVSPLFGGNAGAHTHLVIDADGERGGVGHHGERREQDV